MWYYLNVHFQGQRVNHSLLYSFLSLFTQLLNLLTSDFTALILVSFHLFVFPFCVTSLLICMYTNMVTYFAPLFPDSYVCVLSAFLDTVLLIIAIYLSPEKRASPTYPP